MKAIDILNSDELDISQKLSLLTTGRDPDMDKYIKYYDGDQKILDREHPTDISKNDKINKIVFNLYKKIVNTATYFLFGESPILKLRNPEDEYKKLFETFKDSYESSGTEKMNQLIGINTFAYSESAEIIYKKKKKVGYQLLSPETEKMYTIKDDFGDMDSFIRVFKLKEFVESKVQEIEYTEVYTQTEMYRFRNFKNKIVVILPDGTETEEIKPNKTYKDIPIVYYKIKEPLPWQVKTLLDRYNLQGSALGDVNDYFSFPILKLIGHPVTGEEDEETKEDDQTESLSKNTPNVIQMENKGAGGDNVRADADFLVWSQRPESAIYELDNLKKMGLYLTGTPDISLDNLKSLESVSGVALKLMFLDAIAESKTRQHIFNKLQDRIEKHKVILGSIDGNDYSKLQIFVEFQDAIPDNVKELIENINNSFTSGTISIDTAVENNPLVNDSVIEIKKIEDSTVESFE